MSRRNASQVPGAYTSALRRPAGYYIIYQEHAHPVNPRQPGAPVWRAFFTKRRLTDGWTLIVG